MSGYEYYGIYRSCRDAAWKCQLNFGMAGLPVKLTGVARQAGIRIVKNSDVGELREGECGVSIFDGEAWIVIYDDRCEPSCSRTVLAHELGHIFLGHEYRISECRFASGTRPELDADRFAQRLLAPAFALHELGALNAEDISRLCDVPLDFARKRARRMKLLEARSEFYKSKLEREVFEVFRPWLEEYRENVGQMSAKCVCEKN